MRSQSQTLASTNQPMTQPVTMALVAWDPCDDFGVFVSMFPFDAPSQVVQVQIFSKITSAIYEIADLVLKNSGPKGTKAIQEYRKGVSFSMKTGPVRLSLGFHHVPAASHLRAATRLRFRLRLAGCESALSSSKITGYDCSCPSNQRGKPAQNVEP